MAQDYADVIPPVAVAGEAPRTPTQPQVSTPLPVDDNALRALGVRLKGRFDAYKRDRRETEAQWTANLRQYLGRYDPEMVSRIEQDRSRAYPKLTRVKVVSMVSRLMALLFPTSEKNWGLQASKSPTFDAHVVQQVLDVWARDNPGTQITRPELDRALSRAATVMAQMMEREIDDQLMDIGGSAAMDYVALVRRVMFSAVLYGVGVLKGPMTLTRSQAAYDVRMGEVVVTQQEMLRPFYEFVPCWDYYPDMSAKTFAAMDGQFQRHVFSRHQFRRLADRPDFMGARVKQYLETHNEGNYRRESYETDLRSLGGRINARDEGRKYEVIEYWGYVYGQDLRAAGVSVPDNKLSDELRASIWMVDDQIIKAVENPFGEGVQMYHQFVFEEDEVNLMGSGLPPICRDSQLGVCAATRMLVDNASVTCGPQLEVNLDMLRTDQDTKGVKPFKVWYRDDAGGQVNAPAVRNVTIDSHIPELMQMVDMFMGFADKETFVSPTTGGDMEGAPSEPLRTASGASMILGNAALPFRDIVRNFDQFTMSVIHSLVEWNRMFNPNPDIKGDLQPVARGATSLIAKEVRAMALDNLATTLRPEETMYVDMQELIKARVSVRDLPTEMLMLSEEEVAQKQQQQQQMQMQQQQMQEEVMRANVRKVLAEAFKATSQARKNLDGSDAAMFNAVLSALEKGIDPNVIKGFTQEPASAGVQQPDIGGDIGGQAVAGGQY